MAETGIRFYRGKRRLSQAAVAAELGLDGGAMSRLENGDLIPSAEQVDKLVVLLKVPPSHLFSKHILDEVAERAWKAEGITKAEASS